MSEHVRKSTNSVTP